MSTCAVGCRVRRVSSEKPSLGRESRSWQLALTRRRVRRTLPPPSAHRHCRSSLNSAGANSKVWPIRTTGPFTRTGPVRDKGAFMGAASHIVQRGLIWLTVIALPFQAVTFPHCGCAHGAREEKSVAVVGGAQSDRSEQASCCCCSAEAIRAGRCCCCSARQTRLSHACCSKSEGKTRACNCGPDCRCGDRREPEPAVPSSDDAPAVKPASDVAQPPAFVTADGPCNAHRRQWLRVDSDAMTSLRRCSALCRFTL